MHTRHKTGLRAALLTAGFLSITAPFAIIATPGLAQDAAAQTQSTADANTSVETGDDQTAPPPRSRRRTLDEVIVTAQRRAQNLQEVPMSVTAIGEMQIEQSNMEDLNDLSRYTPNLKVQAGGLANFIYIRGLGSGYNEGFEQSVGLFIDDIYYAKPHYLVVGMLDVERVEVLRGPQGTLFGKNTVAGALTIHSGTPSNEFEGSFDVTAGSDQQRNFQMMLNVPIIEDKLSVRLAGFYWDRNGLLFNTYYDFQEEGFTIKTARAKVKFDPTDKLSFDFMYLKNKGVVTRGGRIQLSAAPEHWLQVFREFDEDVEASIENFNTSVDQPASGFQDSDDYVVRAEAQVFDHDLIFIGGTSSYVREGYTDLDGTPVQVFQTEIDQNYTQYTAELRVVSPPGRFEYVAGAFYSYNDTYDFNRTLSSNTEDYFDQLFGFSSIERALAEFPEQIPFVLDAITPAGGGNFERREALFLQLSEAVSFYGQLTWNPSQDWTLIAGARYGVDWKDVSYDQKIGTEAGFPGPTLVQGPILRMETFDDKVKRRETDFAPKLSVLWRAFDWGNIYATIAMGGKSGGFNALALRNDDTQFRPESALTYETGIKMELFGNSLRLNVGVFRTEFDDLQTTIFDGIDIIVKNAPAAISQGLEADMFTIFDFGLSVIGSFAYLDAYYTDYKLGPCVARSVFIDIAFGQQFCDLTGAPLANAPDIQSSLSLNQVIPLGNWPVDLTLGADILYHGRMYLQPDLDPLDTQKAYWMFNARAGVQSRDQRFTLTVFLRNVTDEIIRLGGIDAPLFDGTHVGVIDQPRSLSVHLTASF